MAVARRWHRVALPKSGRRTQVVRGAVEVGVAEVHGNVVLPAVDLAIGFRLQQQL